MNLLTLICFLFYFKVDPATTLLNSRQTNGTLEGKSRHILGNSSYNYKEMKIAEWCSMRINKHPILSHLSRKAVLY
jgi:hypothetical protein